MIYCGSLSLLLYIASCESLLDQPITFIHYADVTPGHPDVREETQTIWEWTRFICERTRSNLTFLELKSTEKDNWKSDLDKQTSWIEYSRQLIEHPNLKIENGDTIADGILNVWVSITKHMELNIIGHGAGSLNIIPALCGFSSKFVSHLRLFRNLHVRHKIKKIFLYNGIGQQTRKYLPWYLLNKVEFIEGEDVNRICKKLAKELAGREPFIEEISKIRGNVTLYAPTLEVEDHDYPEYLDNQIKQYPFAANSVFIIKNHPRDTRNYEKYFQDLGLEALSLSSMKWRWLPLEIILNINPTIKYLGCYSSSMVSVDSERRYVNMPASNEIVKFYLREYSGLLKTLGSI